MTKSILKIFGSWSVAFTMASILLAGAVQLSSSVVAPSSAQAQTSGYQGLVQCDGVILKDKNGNVIEEDKGKSVCNFQQLVASINYLVKWLFALAAALSIVLFTWAGFLYISGVEKNIAKARGIFMHVVGGLIIMLCAWFIVYTIVSWIGNGDSAFTSLLDGGNVKK